MCIYIYIYIYVFQTHPMAYHIIMPKGAEPLTPHRVVDQPMAQSVAHRSHVGWMGLECLALSGFGSDLISF